MRYIAIGVFAIVAIYFLAPFARDWGRQIVKAYRSHRDTETPVDADAEPADQYNREDDKTKA